VFKRLFDWFFGIPWVFQKLRYWVLGGFDFGPAYQRLNVEENDVVLDIGCGMGDSMQHLKSFRRYYGFDTDSRAIETFRKKYPAQNIILNNRVCTADDIRQLQPSKCILIGLLHHINDDDARTLLRSLAEAAELKGTVTLDTVYVPGRWVNNALAAADRGRHVRMTEHYRQLFSSGGMDVQEEFWIVTGNGAARYLGAVLHRSQKL
jgi:cyclopropane fatty-acyl-phospholipid synthase-like methyltransferase